MFQLVFTFPSQLCFGGWYFCWQSWVGLLAGDPVDLVRQQDQHDPPGRLRRAHQVGGGAGTRLVSLLSFLLRIHNISRWTPTIQWEMETFPASSLNLDRQSNEKASNLTLLFANHAQLSVSPTRLLFHSSETAGNFSGFSGPEFFAAIHTSNCFWFPPTVQTFRTSNCLLWLLQKEKCGPGISSPIQIISSQTCERVRKWKPSLWESQV